MQGLLAIAIGTALALTCPPAPPCAAEPLATVLTDSGSEYLLGERASMLRDRAGTLTIEEVSSPGLEPRFQPVTSRRPNLGHTHDRIWFRFRIRNATAREEWVLSVGKEWTEAATLFSRLADGTWARLDTGVVVPFFQKPIPHEDPLLPLRIRTGETREYYLLVHSDTTPLMLHLSLAEKDQAAYASALTRLSYGGLYFVLLVMALYHVVLAAALKDARFLLIGLFLICYLVLESGVHGHLALVVLPGTPLFAQRLVLVASSAGGVAVLLFAQRILDTKRTSPFLHRLLAVGCLIEAGMIAVTSVTMTAHQVVFWTEGVIAVIAQGAGIRRCLDRDRSAILFTVALTAWMIPGTFVIGAILGLLPLNPFTEQGVHVGVVVMTILFSLAVADQTNQVHRASQRFVPKPLLSRLGRASIVAVKPGDSIEDEMTVLFCDIRGFTTRSERMTPAATFAFLNEYLGHLVPVIQRHGGLIDKYIGDAIMAIFPASADSALAAAIAVQETVDIFNAGRAAPEERVAVGIGLHRGRLMLGTVGDNTRMEVTVISDAVNVAARLESLTKEKAAPIIVSKAVVDALTSPEKFSLVERGSVPLKGRVAPIDIWAVELPAGPTEGSSQPA